MEAKNIEEVIKFLDNIIYQARTDNSRIGYFSALYLKVTKSVRDGIKNGDFEDGERMERLDVNFANRYFVALDKYKNNEKPTQAWQLALKSTKNWWPLVLQHILLGINAHINLDLGIAAVKTVKKGELDSLHNDFNEINNILASLVNGVENDLAQVWPPLHYLDLIAGKTEEAVINFSMTVARDSAWQFAKNLEKIDTEAEQGKFINERDVETAMIGNRVRHPGIIIGSVTRFIRLREVGTVNEIINILS